MFCFVVVMQSFIMNSHEVFIHIHQGYFAGTGAIVRLPQCQWSKPDGCGTISQCITTTKHSKAKTVCIFLGINCIISPEMVPFLASQQQPLRVRDRRKNCKWGTNVSFFLKLRRLKVTGVEVQNPGPCLNIKTVFPRYRDSHVKDKTVARPSYL